jgi:hypothetical protein
MSGACLLAWGWGQWCQSFLNFGLELQLDLRRRSRGLQLIPLLVSGLVRSHRRREWLSLHDMQGYNLRDAYTLFYFTIKLQSNENIIYLLHISFTSLLGSHLSGINYFI